MATLNEMDGIKLRVITMNVGSGSGKQNQQLQQQTSVQRTVAEARAGNIPENRGDVQTSVCVSDDGICDVDNYRLSTGEETDIFTNKADMKDRVVQDILKTKSPDILMVQECHNLNKYSFVGQENTGVGIIYNRNRINILCSTLKELGQKYRCRMIDLVKSMRISICEMEMKEAPGEPFVVISWHGPHRAPTSSTKATMKVKDKKFIAKTMIDVSKQLKRNIDSPILIGGDFNINIETLRDEMPEHGPFSVREYKASPRREKSGVKDYFIYTADLLELPKSLCNCVDLKEASRVNNPEDIFDHDPVIATVVFNKRFPRGEKKKATLDEYDGKSKKRKPMEDEGAGGKKETVIVPAKEHKGNMATDKPKETHTRSNSTKTKKTKRKIENQAEENSPSSSLPKHGKVPGQLQEGALTKQKLQKITKSTAKHDGTQIQKQLSKLSSPDCKAKNAKGNQSLHKKDVDDHFSNTLSHQEKPNPPRVSIAQVKQLENLKISKLKEGREDSHKKTTTAHQGKQLQQGAITKRKLQKVKKSTGKHDGTQIQKQITKLSSPDCNAKKAKGAQSLHKKNVDDHSSITSPHQDKPIPPRVSISHVKQLEHVKTPKLKEGREDSPKKTTTAHQGKQLQEGAITKRKLQKITKSIGIQNGMQIQKQTTKLSSPGCKAKNAKGAHSLHKKNVDDHFSNSPPHQGKPIPPRVSTSQVKQKEHFKIPKLKQVRENSAKKKSTAHHGEQQKLYCRDRSRSPGPQGLRIWGASRPSLNDPGHLDGPDPPQVEAYVDKYGDARFRSSADKSDDVSDEVVFGNEKFEIKLGAPPKRIQLGREVVEVFADPSKRGVFVDGVLVYRLRERVKEVEIRGRKRKISYHGRPLNLWIEGREFEVRVDSPPKAVWINNKRHTIEVDGSDMMILLDRQEKVTYGDLAKFIKIDGKWMDIRFDPPSRDIRIDGKLYELKRNMAVPCVILKGKQHPIRYVGPPRDVRINGFLYKIFTDRAIKLRISNRFHYVSLGGPCHELIIDGKWFEVKFGEPYKKVTLGNTVLNVRLLGNPSEVTFLPELMRPAEPVPMQPISGMGSLGVSPVADLQPMPTMGPIVLPTTSDTPSASRNQAYHYQEIPAKDPRPIPKLGPFIQRRIPAILPLPGFKSAPVGDSTCQSSHEGELTAGDIPITPGHATAKHKEASILLCLFNNDAPLGFLVDAAFDQNGRECGLVVYDIEPGRRIDRDGRLKIQDTIIEINGHDLNGVKLPDAQDILNNAIQSYEVRMKIVKHSVPLPPPPPPPPALLPKSQEYSPVKPNPLDLASQSLGIGTPQTGPEQTSAAKQNTIRSEKDMSTGLENTIDSMSCFYPAGQSVSPRMSLPPAPPFRSPSTTSDDEISQDGNSSMSRTSTKNLVEAKSAPTNTKKIVEKVEPELVKGPTGSGLNETTRDNMREGPSPVYTRNIPSTKAANGARLTAGDRLPELAPLGDSTSQSSHEREITAGDIPKTSVRATAKHKEVIILLSLFNSDTPLGCVVDAAFDQKGRECGLMVQDIEPGGRIDRDGRLKIKDTIIEINGHDLNGITLPDARDILNNAIQSYEVRMKIVKHSVPLPPPPPPPPALLPKSQEYSPVKPNPLDLAPQSLGIGTPQTGPEQISATKQNTIRSEKDMSTGLENTIDSMSCFHPAGQSVSPSMSVPPAPPFRSPLTTSDDEISQDGNSSMSRTSTKNLVEAKSAPTNTKKIVEKVEPELVKGSTGSGLNETTRDNMREGPSPVYTRNIPSTKVANGARLTAGDRLPELAPLGDSTSQGSHEREITAGDIPKTSVHATAKHKEVIILLSLFNSDTPLGCVVDAAFDQKGRECGLMVQDIEPGGRIDRDGRLKIKDTIIEINGHDLNGITLPDARDILNNAIQSYEVRMKIVKHSVPLPPPPPPPPALLPKSQEYSPVKPNPLDLAPQSLGIGTPQTGPEQISATKQNTIRSEKDMSTGLENTIDSMSCFHIAGQSVSPSMSVPPAPPFRSPSTTSDDEISQDGNRSMSRTSTKNLVEAKSAPTNTKKIVEKVEPELVKGPTGSGLNETTRDNKREGPSPVYTRNIPSTKAANGARMTAGDRLPELAPLGDSTSQGSHEREITAGDIPKTSVHATAKHKEVIILLSLFNSDTPLGCVVDAAFDQKGRECGLVVQDIEPGGRIDRDGRLKIKDTIIEINGHDLDGIKLPDARDILNNAIQSYEVRMKIVKHSVPLPPPPPPPPALLPKSKEYSPVKPNSLDLAPQSLGIGTPQTGPEQTSAAKQNTIRSEKDMSTGLENTIDSMSCFHPAGQSVTPRMRVPPAPPLRSPSTTSDDEIGQDGNGSMSRTLTKNVVEAPTNTKKIVEKVEPELVKGPTGSGLNETTRNNTREGPSPVYPRNIPSTEAANGARLTAGDRLPEDSRIIPATDDGAEQVQRAVDTFESSVSVPSAVYPGHLPRIPYTGPGVPLLPFDAPPPLFSPYHRAGTPRGPQLHQPGVSLSQDGALPRLPCRPLLVARRPRLNIPKPLTKEEFKQEKLRQLREEMRALAAPIFRETRPCSLSEARQHSPRARPISPKANLRHPRAFSMSPRRRSMSPNSRSRSPSRGSISPNRKSSSPSRRPRTRSRSPSRGSMSPNRRSSSSSRRPRARSRSPSRRLMSPNSKSSSPNRRPRMRSRSADRSRRWFSPIRSNSPYRRSFPSARRMRLFKRRISRSMSPSENNSHRGSPSNYSSRPSNLKPTDLRHKLQAKRRSEKARERNRSRERSMSKERNNGRKGNANYNDKRDSRDQSDRDNSCRDNRSGKYSRKDSMDESKFVPDYDDIGDSNDNASTDSNSES